MRQSEIVGSRPASHQSVVGDVRGEWGDRGCMEIIGNEEVRKGVEEKKDLRRQTGSYGVVCDSVTGVESSESNVWHDEM